MKRISTIKQNIIANFTGRIWAGLINFIFIPVYVRLLGIESYGLIGLFVSLTTLLYILDMGLSVTLNRILAQYSGSDDKKQEQRDLLRTFEIIYWLIGIFVGLFFIIMGPALAAHWIKPQNIAVSTIKHAFMLMGIVIAFQWPSTLYIGGLMGLQKQVLLNLVRILTSTVQACGAVLVLWLISRTILAYFMWQICIIILQTLVFAYYLWYSLPLTDQKSAFRMYLLKRNWKFSAGMTLISIMATILTQLDKIILSKLLVLVVFGYYILAVNIANIVLQFTNPVFLALFPMFSQMAAEGKDKDTTLLYHKGCQFISLFTIPISMILIFFSKEILFLWIRDTDIIKNTYLLLSLITTGSMLNSVMALPFALQVAYGWIRLSFYKGAIALVLMVPLLFLGVKIYGPVGAAVVWIILNAGYFLLEIPIMHRRLLKGEMWKWYFYDVGIPFFTVFFIVFFSKILMPYNISIYGGLIWIIFTGLLAVFFSGLSMSFIRKGSYSICQYIAQFVRKRFLYIFALEI